MSRLTQRVETLEKQAGTGCEWHGIREVVKVWPEDDPAEVEAKIAAIEEKARAEGWSEKCGPCVVIIEYVRDWKATEAIT